VANIITCPLIQVESDVIVPIEEAAPKEEYSAATLRRKLLPLLNRYLLPITEGTPRIDSSNYHIDTFDISDLGNVISNLKINRSVRPVDGFHGGTKKAKLRLDDFIHKKLDNYSDLRNDPNEECQSNLSPYLHFGQISPIYIALRVSEHGGPGMEAFLEELVIRRELSINFVHYNPQYDSFNGLPEWAKRTLTEHGNDPREYLYTRDILEQANTHDPYWNAAQREMMLTGKMHGYMRMYWGKKILEWTANPEEAFNTAIYLNNKYELDGRDPNSFTGVAWCFGKHDRPWGTRPVFGNIRYMSAGGLKRKFDLAKYTEKYTSHNL
jgi:deoxyribodipyrimidine photo-lyase